MLGSHNAEGHLPGLGESLVSERAARGVVSEKYRRLLDDSAGLMAMGLWQDNWLDRDLLRGAYLPDDN
jgi:hypothetical protein